MGLYNNPVLNIQAGTAALSLKIGPPERNKYWRILQAELHLSTAGGTGTLTVTHNSTNGSKYSTVIKALTMDTVTDWVWYQGDENEFYGPDDHVEFYYLNSGGKTFGLNVLTIPWKGDL